MFVSASNIRVGSDNTWELMDGYYRDGSLLVSYEQPDATVNQFKVTVTIKGLTRRAIKLIDVGGLFVCLTTAESNTFCRDGWRNNPINSTISQYNNPLKIRPAFQKVIHGKNKYVFNIGPITNVLNLCNKRNNRRCIQNLAEKLPQTALERHPLYIKLGAGLLNLKTNQYQHRYVLIDGDDEGWAYWNSIPPLTESRGRYCPGGRFATSDTISIPCDIHNMSMNI